MTNASFDQESSERLQETRRNKMFIALLLAAIAFAAFGRFPWLDFVTYDDTDYVTKNHHVQKGLTRPNIVWAFETRHATNWHPITWLSHMLDCHLFGMQPGWHHFTSVLIHAVNGVLLFVLLARITGALWRSALVAALFAVHPLHVESVAWVSERKDVLSTLFGLLALWAYVSYVETPKVAHYGLVVLWFALSLMSKPMLVTLPFALLLLDFWPLKRLGLRFEHAQSQFESGQRIVDSNRFSSIVILEKLPLLALSIISCAITVWAQKTGGAMSTLELVPLSSRISNAVVVYAAYIVQMFWPAQLAVLYPLQLPLPVWMVGGAAALLVIITTGVFMLNLPPKRPWLLTGWLWYLGTLVPVIGLVQVGEQSRADRYTYVPLIGLFIMIAWSLPTVWARKLLLPLWLLIIALLAVLTWRQTEVWRNGITLFEHCVRVTGRHPVASNNLGVAMLAENNFAEAEVHFRDALQLRERHASAHNNLGVALVKQKKLEEAEVQFQEARRLRPTDIQAVNNLGMIRTDQGRYDEAIAFFEEALRSRPDYLEGLVNCGAAWEAKGDLDQAISHYRRALEVNPNSVETMHNLAGALLTQGKTEESMKLFKTLERTDTKNPKVKFKIAASLESNGDLLGAVAAYREVISIEPKHAGAHAALAAILVKQKDAVDEGYRHFERAISIDPDNAVTRYNYGTALARQGRLDQAIEQLRRAVQLKPDHARARMNFANALSTQKNYDEAVEHYTEAMRLSPDNAETPYNFGNSLLTQGKPEQAIDQYRHALRLKPEYKDARFNLGIALAKLGKREEAIAQFQQVLQLWPDHGGAKAAMRELTGAPPPGPAAP